MGQARAVEVVVADEEGVEHLRLALKTAECGAVQDAVAVHLKRGAMFAGRRAARREVCRVEGRVESVHAGLSAKRWGITRGSWVIRQPQTDSRPIGDRP